MGWPICTSKSFVTAWEGDNAVSRLVLRGSRKWLAERTISKAPVRHRPRSTSYTSDSLLIESEHAHLVLSSCSVSALNMQQQEINMQQATVYRCFIAEHSLNTHREKGRHPAKLGRNFRRGCSKIATVPGISLRRNPSQPPSRCVYKPGARQPSLPSRH